MILHFVVYGTLWWIIKKYVFSDSCSAILRAVYQIELKHYTANDKDVHLLAYASTLLCTISISIVRILTQLLMYGFLDLSTINHVYLLTMIHTADPFVVPEMIMVYFTTDPIVSMAVSINSISYFMFVLKRLATMHKNLIVGDTMLLNFLNNVIASYHGYSRQFPHIRRIILSVLLVMYVVNVDKICTYHISILYWFAHNIFYKNE